MAQDEKLATLTEADVARIQAEQAVARHVFVEEEPLDEDVAHEYERVRPLYEGYFRQGPIRLTLQRRNGACVFHSPATGCTLSDDARPTACRLYPFEPWPDGSITLLVDRHGSVDAAAHAGGGCLGVEEAESMEALLVLFGVRAETLQGLAERLRTDTRAHGFAVSRQEPAPEFPRRRLRRDA